MNSSWKKWQSVRERELIKNGVEPAIAQKFSQLEAKGRARIGEHTGFLAASKAVLGSEELPDGSRIWRIFIDPELVPAHRQAAASPYLPTPLWAINRKL